MVTLNVIATPNMIMPQGGLVAGIYQPSPRDRTLLDRSLHLRSAIFIRVNIEAPSRDNSCFHFTLTDAREHILSVVI
jgi:hypothetical protein